MKVIITKKQPIKTKKGDDMTIYHAIAEDGEGVTMFLTPEQIKDWEITDQSVSSKAQLANIFKTLPVCEAEFNQRGRLVDVAV